MTPLDPATVQRCIEALKGTGRYDVKWDMLGYAGALRKVESWTYTTHPMDILAALLMLERHGYAEHDGPFWKATTAGIDLVERTPEE